MFYVIDKKIVDKNTMLQVLDTSDGVAEWYSYKEVKDIIQKENIAVFGIKPLKVYPQTSCVFNKHIASIILGRGLRYLCSIKDFNIGTLGFTTESLSFGEYGFEDFEYNGVAYKLNGRIDDFKAFSKDFKTCFAKLGANYHYFEPRIEDARNLAINCLDFLSAIRSEGFSTQNAFKGFPILEKYYKRYSLSNLEIFMNVISSGTADIKTFYTVLAKVKRELSKTD